MSASLEQKQEYKFDRVSVLLQSCAIFVTFSQFLFNTCLLSPKQTEVFWDDIDFGWSISNDVKEKIQSCSRMMYVESEWKTKVVHNIVLSMSPVFSEMRFSAESGIFMSLSNFYMHFHFHSFQPSKTSDFTKDTIEILIEQTKKQCGLQVRKLKWEEIKNRMVSDCLEMHGSLLQSVILLFNDDQLFRTILQNKYCRQVEYLSLNQT